MTRKRNTSSGRRTRRRSNGARRTPDADATVAEESRSAAAAERDPADHAVIDTPSSAAGETTDETSEIDETGTYSAVELEDADTGADGVALNSLHRLEHDIRELHDRWAAVESEIATRDMEIARLEEDRSIQHTALKALRAEVEDLQASEARLRNELAARDQHIQDMQAGVEQHDDELAAKEGLIAKAEAHAATLQAELDGMRSNEQELQRRLDAQREDFAGSNDQITQLNTTISELKVTIADLESYIDRRKSEWDRQSSEIEQYRDALAGMEFTLEDQAAEVSREQEEKTELSAEILSLKNQCAELDGRRAEREQANQELQERLSGKTVEIEALRQEVLAASQENQPLAQQLADRQTELDMVRGELEGLKAETRDKRRESDRAIAETRANADNELATMRATVESALDDVAEHQKRLRESEEQAVRFLDQLTEQRQKFDQVWEVAQKTEEKLNRVTAERDELETELDDLRIKLDEVQSEFSEYRDSSASDLESSAEHSLELERELEARNAALKALDRNVAMMDEINASVQRLDEQISQSNAKPRQHDTGSAGIRRLMVALKGDRKVRYPLYKQTMTIGRSPEADIQVRQRWISRKHARIVVGEDSVTIEDLGSKNGILINNESVRSSELHNEDVIEIGDMQFQFVEMQDIPPEQVA